MIRACLLALGLCVLAACWPVEEMRADRLAKKVAAYEAANPGKPLDQATYLALQKEAEVEVAVEIEAAKAEALKKAAEAAANGAGAAITGNMVGGIASGLLALGAIAAYFGIGRKAGVDPAKLAEAIKPAEPKKEG